jgi:hypothetical protein
MLTAPILPMLVRLSLPNMMAMLAMALVTIAETAYVGILGTPPLAGLALVFPLVMLQRCCQAAAWAAVFRPLLVARLARRRTAGVRSWSMLEKAKRPRDLRSTFSWWRSTRISASSAGIVIVPTLG